MTHTQFIEDYKKIIDRTIFSPDFLSLGQFTSENRQSEDGTTRTTIISYASACCSMSTPIGLTYVSLASIIFSMLDLLLEKKGVVHGGNFKDRCLSLNVSQVSSDTEKIQEYVYRILKQIRNCVIHNISSISLNKNSIQLHYTLSSSSFDLVISPSNLEKVLQIAYYLSCGLSPCLQSLPDMYISGALASIYDKLISETVITDNIQHVPYRLNTPIKLAVPHREQHLETRYEVVEDQLICIENINHNYIRKYNIDYIFSYNGKQYVVPQELLDQEKRIPIRKLEPWAMKN